MYNFINPSMLLMGSEKYTMNLLREYKRKNNVILQGNYKIVSVEVEENVLASSLPDYNGLREVIKGMLSSSSGIMKDAIWKRLVSDAGIWIELSPGESTGIAYIGKSKKKIRGFREITGIKSGIPVYVELGYTLISNKNSGMNGSSVIGICEDGVRRWYISYSKVPDGLHPVSDEFWDYGSHTDKFKNVRWERDFKEYKDYSKLSKGIKKSVEVINRKGIVIPFLICGDESGNLVTSPGMLLSESDIYEIVGSLSNLPPFYSVMFDNISGGSDVRLYYSEKCSERGSADLWVRRVK